MTEGGPSRANAALRPGAKLAVAVVRHDARWRAAGVTDAVLARWARAGFAAAPASPGGYEMSLLLTDDREMRALNRTWRGKDAPTNVLSFPASDNRNEPGFLGDVALAYETARREADATGIALPDHAAHLVVHGVLHLLGFDHATDEEAERMEALERRALAALGIKDPYAESGARPAEVSP